MPAADAASRFAETIRNTAAPLTPDQAVLEHMLAGGRAVGFGKSETLMRAGEVAERLLFVHSGLIRYYYLDPVTGDERTGQFFAEDSVVTDAASFIGGTASTQTFDAIEATVVFSLPRAALLRACDEDHAIERFARKMVEGALIGAQRRSANLLVLSPDERYRLFLRTRPEIARRVPQYLLASYLGITPESLSRIRGRLARPAKD